MIPRKRFVLFVVFFAILSCSFLNKPYVYLEHNKWTGKNFIFVALDDNYRGTDSFNKIWSKINKKRYTPYHKFLDNRYFIAGIQKQGYQNFLIIEDGKENRYKMALKFNGNNEIIIPSYMLFEDTELKAKETIGKTIWLNNTLDFRNFFSLSNYEFSRFEEVIILDVIPFQNSDLECPIWLKISNYEGNEGLVRYDENKSIVGSQVYYYESNPLPKKWGKRIIKKILNQNISLGMTDIQVRIAIGNPNEINTTSSRHGISEQWIYNNKKGFKSYYQFEYGRLIYTGQ